ncbi:MAG TPA: SDR family oxidoreductase [Dehalococcoidia bacterium]|nr:SDR family oxidoreductase [Dehalococcoidia bacterium]
MFTSTGAYKVTFGLCAGHAAPVYLGAPRQDRGVITQKTIFRRRHLVDLQLTGKKAIVTGGSRGIGRAIARQLALEGCDVAICARRAGPLNEAADALAKESGRKVVGIVCDTLDPESIKGFVNAAAQQLGGINIVINSAARVGGTAGTVENVSDMDVLRDFEEKVVGYLRMVQAAVPFMKQAGWGRVVNVSGGAGRAPGVAVSGGVRNAGTINLTKSMANALGPYGINVNAIYPGQTITEATIERYTEQAARDSTTVDALLKKADDGTILKHVVTATDIGNFVAFLCSPLAIGIHGEAIGIDGGNRADMHF